MRQILQFMQQLARLLKATVVQDPEFRQRLIDRNLTRDAAGIEPLYGDLETGAA